MLKNKKTIYYFFALCIFILSIAACTSCAKKDQLPDANIPTPISDASHVWDSSDLIKDASVEHKPLKVSGDVWSLTFENGRYWAVTDYVEEDASSNFEVQIASQQYKTMIFLSRERTELLLQGYFLLQVREMKEHDLSIISSYEFNLNSRKFIVVETLRDEIRGWSFFTMKNKDVYTIVCMTQSEEIKKEFCMDILKTFTIKE